MEQAIDFRVGDLSLEARLSLPAGGATTGVVLCHPHPLYGGDMGNNVVVGLAEALQRAGHATLRFNFRGVGQSGGSHGGGTAELDDVGAAVGALLARQALDRVVVAGYSFGAWVGLQAGARDPRVHALIGIALPIASRDSAFLEAVAKPKLLVAGDRDDYCPLAALRALHARLADPKALAVVTGADHFFWGLERDVARAALAFLDGEL